MLDPAMTYSCAVFERPDASLEQAELAKLERVCEKLRLTPRDRVFMNQHIFPGGSLPSVEVLRSQLARHTDLELVSLDDITTHYVTTLARWRDRFAAHAEELQAIGYDERFQRLWMLYLAYCEAGFAERRIQDVQLLLTKPGCGLRGGNADASDPLKARARIEDSGAFSYSH